LQFVDKHYSDPNYPSVDYRRLFPQQQDLKTLMSLIANKKPLATLNRQFANAQVFLEMIVPVIEDGTNHGHWVHQDKNMPNLLDNNNRDELSKLKYLVYRNSFLALEVQRQHNLDNLDELYDAELENLDLALEVEEDAIEIEAKKISEAVIEQKVLNLMIMTAMQLYQNNHDILISIDFTSVFNLPHNASIADKQAQIYALLNAQHIKPQLINAWCDPEIIAYIESKHINNQVGATTYQLLNNKKLKLHNLLNYAHQHYQQKDARPKPYKSNLKKEDILFTAAGRNAFKDSDKEKYAKDNINSLGFLLHETHANTRSTIKTVESPYLEEAFKEAKKTALAQVDHAYETAANLKQAYVDNKNHNERMLSFEESYLDIESLGVEWIVQKGKTFHLLISTALFLYQEGYDIPPRISVDNFKTLLNDLYKKENNEHKQKALQALIDAFEDKDVIACCDNKTLDYNSQGGNNYQTLHNQDIDLQALLSAAYDSQHNAAPAHGDIEFTAANRNNQDLYSQNIQALTSFTNNIKNKYDNLINTSFNNLPNSFSSFPTSLQANIKSSVDDISNSMITCINDCTNPNSQQRSHAIHALTQGINFYEASNQLYINSSQAENAVRKECDANQAAYKNKFEEHLKSDDTKETILQNIKNDFGLIRDFDIDEGHIEAMMRPIRREVNRKTAKVLKKEIKAEVNKSLAEARKTPSARFKQRHPNVVKLDDWLHNKNQQMQKDAEQKLKQSGVAAWDAAHNRFNYVNYVDFTVENDLQRISSALDANTNFYDLSLLNQVYFRNLNRDLGRQYHHNEDLFKTKLMGVNHTKEYEIILDEINNLFIQNPPNKTILITQKIHALQAVLNKIQNNLGCLNTVLSGFNDSNSGDRYLGIDNVLQIQRENRLPTRDELNSLLFNLTVFSKQYPNLEYKLAALTDLVNNLNNPPTADNIKDFLSYRKILLDLKKSIKEQHDTLNKLAKADGITEDERFNLALTTQLFQDKAKEYDCKQNEFIRKRLAEYPAEAKAMLKKGKIEFETMDLLKDDTSLMGGASHIIKGPWLEISKGKNYVNNRVTYVVANVAIDKNTTKKMAVSFFRNVPLAFPTKKRLYEHRIKPYLNWMEAMDVKGLESKQLVGQWTKNRKLMIGFAAAYELKAGKALDGFFLKDNERAYFKQFKTLIAKEMAADATKQVKQSHEEDLEQYFSSQENQQVNQFIEKDQSNIMHAFKGRGGNAR